MRLVLILLAATGVVYGIGKAVPSWKDAGAPPRWLETGGAYTHADLRTWVTTNPEFAARYVMPTLFPIDLLFMAFLAAFLAEADPLEGLDRDRGVRSGGGACRQRRRGASHRLIVSARLQPSDLPAALSCRHQSSVFRRPSSNDTVGT